MRRHDLTLNGSLPSAPSAEPPAPIPLLTSRTTKCPRCKNGTILGRGENASCLSCGYEPITVNEYVDAEAWVAALPLIKDGTISKPRGGY